MNRYISALLLLATGLTAQAQNDSTFTGTAQKGFYVRAGLGYAAPQSTVVTSTSLYDFKDKRGDYATGLNEAIGAGYMFNSHIGVELNANLYAGKNKYNFTEYTNPSGVYGNYEMDQYHVNTKALALLMPALVLQTGPGNWTLYSRLAAVLPVVDNTGYNFTATNGGDYEAQTFTQKDRFTIGFSGAAGVKYKVGRRLHVWAEASYLCLTPYIKSMTLTSSSENGVSNISGITQKTTNYSNNFTITNNSSGSTASAQQAYTKPYSNTGIQAGVSLDLGGMEAGQPDAAGHAGGHLYFKAGAGYAAPMPGINNMGNSSTANYTSSESVSVKPMSYSTGLHALLSAGYMFGSHVGVELGGDFEPRSKIYTFTNQYSGATAASDGGSSFSVQAQSAVLVMPSLVLQTGGKKINIYVRTGVALPVSNKIISNQSSYNQQQTFSETGTLTTRFTLGYTGAAGLQYHITRHIAIWGEMNLLSLSPLAKEIKETNIVSNGVAQPNQTYNYNKSGTENNLLTNTLTNVAPAYELPYNSIGLQLGIAFHL